MLIFSRGKILWQFGNDNIVIRPVATETEFNKLKSALYKKYGNSYGLFEVRLQIDLLN